MLLKRLIPICSFLSLLGIIAARSANADLPTHGPNNVQAQAVSSTQIYVSWIDVPYTDPPVTSYMLEREFPVDSRFFTSIATNINALNYTDTNLTPNTSYGYRVSAINASGTGPPSTFPASATTPTTPGSSNPPTSPTNLAATPVSDSEIDLAWSAPQNSTVTGYKIEREFGGGFTVIAANTNSASTNYADKTLSPGVTYDYRVSAVNGYGSSSPSPVAIATTFSPPGSPQKAVAVAGDGQAAISWLPPLFAGGGITGYVVIATPLAYPTSTTAGNTTSTIITGLVNGTTYFFSVSAINSAGKGPLTTTNTVTPRSVPSSTAPIVPPPTPTPNPTPPPAGGSALATSREYKFVSYLKKGSRGVAVRELQKRLLAAGLFKAGVSDYFGAVTEAALKAYQRAHFISPTGTVGPLTRAYLNANL